MKKVDYIVVGGGLAGLLCINQLKLKKQTCLLVTSPSLPAASKIAAGTWNPIAFKRFVLSWRAQEFIHEMQVQYPQLEQLLKQKLVDDFPVKKLITEGGELDLWKKQAITPELSTFMDPNPKKSSFPANYYLGEIKQLGRINLSSLITAFHDHLLNKNELMSENFDPHQLIFQDEKWCYKDIVCKGIIFCEGTHTLKNPFFSWLPLKPVKGDVITIKSPQLKLNYILKKNIFILPLGGDLYKVGATYDWKDMSWEPSASAREYLIEKLKTIINVPFEVIDQEAGIRPAAHDRRVLMGEHPQKKGLYVFNGLGSKGVFLGPLAAKEFINHVVQGTVIHPEMDVLRCLKYYHSSLEQDET